MFRPMLAILRETMTQRNTGVKLRHRHTHITRVYEHNESSYRFKGINIILLIYRWLQIL
jgi:hypothetical protein